MCSGAECLQTPGELWALRTAGSVAIGEQTAERVGSRVMAPSWLYLA